MRLLLDTHALLWWLSGDARLGQAARAHVADPANDVMVSVASLWEIVAKVRVGKLRVDIEAVERALVLSRFSRLAIMPGHLAVLQGLAAHHPDPFDHLLIAQAVSEQALLMTEDQAMLRYPVQVLRCGG